MQHYFKSLPFVVLLSLFLLLASAVSLINPLFEAPDEIRHYRYIRKLVVDHALPVQGQEDVRTQSHHPPLYYFLSALCSAWTPSPHTAAYTHPTNPFWGYRNWDTGVDNKVQYWHGPAERFPFTQGFLAALIPRWVNVLLGALTVTLTYGVGRRVWPEHPPLALAAAALVTFNPQFIYTSAAINNDVLAAACGAWVLFDCLGILQAGADRRGRIGLGVAYGCALLAKFHLIVAGALIALTLAWEAWRTPGMPSARAARWLRGMAVVFGIAAALAGWWFARNWLLYGDLTGMNKLNELWHGRPAEGNGWAVWQGLPYLWASLWGRFGYGQIPLPSALYTGILAVCLLALVGYMRPRRSGLTLANAFLLIVTMGIFTAVVFYYMLIQPAGAMGRFLFPALPAFAVLLVGGVEAWLRAPKATAGSVLGGMFALCLVALGGYLLPAVTHPARLMIAPKSPLDVRFGDAARVLAVEVSPAQALPGEPVWVRVTWEPLQWTARPYSVYIHLMDEAGTVVAQRDTWPGLGRAPTTSWRTGAAFVDSYRVDLSESVYAPNRVNVRLGLYEAEWGRLPLIQNGVADSPDQSLDVGAVDIVERPGAWPNAQFANFANEIAFVGYALEPRVLHAGETLTATLYWKVIGEPRYPYAIFAQVLDSEYHVWGSRDGGGVTWTPGSVVTETRHITLLPETPAGSYPLQVGLFHSETGRLPVVADDGRHLDERVLLGPIAVQER
ncbi:MAG TPA: phospholipid carrier-dependent glycosyltransferase [Anaerolineae bacterium]|nr:phospholipid carrier-dependent glycosyltransferase [Anaerolineae bacterium]